MKIFVGPKARVRYNRKTLVTCMITHQSMLFMFDMKSCYSTKLTIVVRMIVHPVEPFMSINMVWFVAIETIFRIAGENEITTPLFWFRVFTYTNQCISFFKMV